ncbi:(2Fe-2S)-binding protein [Paenibacillus ginsengarvi]|nr:(2Fe-2S)-binding protein [Paenibacillus ginsengarvi]
MPSDQSAEQTLDFSLAETYFHISPRGSDNPLFETPAVSLLQPQTMDSLLSLGRDMLRGLDLTISGSFLGLAFFGLPAAVLSFMYQYDGVLDLSLDNLTAQVESHGDHPHLVLKINEVRLKQLPETGRNEAMARELAELFRHSVTPVIELACARIGCKPDLVWNQFGSRMISVNEFILQRAASEAMKDKYRQHYELLVSLAPEEFNHRKNPYVHKPRYIESAYDPQKQVLVRSSCCMWYRKENGVKCYTCPILKDTQREQMKLELREQRAKASS